MKKTGDVKIVFFDGAAENLHEVTSLKTFVADLDIEIILDEVGEHRPDSGSFPGVVIDEQNHSLQHATGMVTVTLSE
jgi:hypothetical protein